MSILSTAYFLGDTPIGASFLGNNFVQYNPFSEPKIPTNGLIALFDATNPTSYTSGNAWYDLTSNRLVATPFGGSTFPTYDSVNKEFQFNGTTNVVYAPISASVATGSIISDFTQIMWVKVPDCGSLTENGVINLQDSNSSAINFDAISFDQLGNKWKLTSANADRNVATSYVETAFNTYLMIAATRASGTNNFIIYREDAVVLGTGTYNPYTYTAASNNASVILMGNRFFNNTTSTYAPDGFFTGSLSSVIMYNRVLSPAELSTIYSVGRFGLSI
jgi:hypothetical protein